MPKFQVVKLAFVFLFVSSVSLPVAAERNASYGWVPFSSQFYSDLAGQSASTMPQLFHTTHLKQWSQHGSLFTSHTAILNNPLTKTDLRTIQNARKEAGAVWEYQNGSTNTDQKIACEYEVFSACADYHAARLLPPLKPLEKDFGGEHRLWEAGQAGNLEALQILCSSNFHNMIDVSSCALLAEQGSDFAKLQLARAQQGRGVHWKPPGDEEIIAQYAEAGYPYDPAKAAGMVAALVKRNDYSARAEYARILLDGEGLPRNDAEAYRQAYSAARVEGHVDGIRWLGLLHVLGRGLFNHLTSDEEVITLLRQAAKANDRESQLLLTIMLGRFGKVEEALVWLDIFDRRAKRSLWWLKTVDWVALEQEAMALKVHRTPDRMASVYQRLTDLAVQQVRISDPALSRFHKTDAFTDYDDITTIQAEGPHPDAEKAFLLLEQHKDVEAYRHAMKAAEAGDHYGKQWLGVLHFSRRGLVSPQQGPTFSAGLTDRDVLNHLLDAAHAGLPLAQLLSANVLAHGLHLQAPEKIHDHDNRLWTSKSDVISALFWRQFYMTRPDRRAYHLKTIDQKAWEDTLFALHEFEMNQNMVAVYARAADYWRGK